MVRRFLMADMPAVPQIGMNICHVKDVAEAHIKALDSSTAPGSRYIVDGGSMLMTEVSVVLADEFSKYPVPTQSAPYCLIWCVARCDKELDAILPQWHKCD